MAIEKELIRLRKEKRFSQMELAEELNVSRQAISKWEQGISTPSTENLIHLAQIYGVTIDTIINGDLQEQTEEVEAL